MQWWYVITVEQWSALGDFLTGVGQVGLALAGAYAGKEWIRQERLLALHDVMKQYLELEFQLNVASAALLSLTGGSMNLPRELRKQDAMVEFDALRIHLKRNSRRCRLYDDALGDEFDVLAKHLLQYGKNFIEWQHTFPVGDAERISPEQHERQKILTLILFVPDSDWWLEYERLSDEIVRRGKKVLWGDSWYSL
jgi:hypothetical protein